MKPEPTRHLYFRTCQKLDNLFSRANQGWGRRDLAMDYPWVVGGVASGRITMRMQRIPLDICEAHKDAPYQLHGTESDNHARMKHAAVDWMLAEGAPDAGAEGRCIVGRADAYSKASDWIVEVGNTPIRKLMACIRSWTTPRFTLVPYQRTGLSDGTARRLWAIDFTWAESLRDQVREDERERCRSDVAAQALDLDNLEPENTSAPYRAFKAAEASRSPLNATSFWGA